MIFIFITYLGLASFFVLPNAMLPGVIARDQSLLESKGEAIYFDVRGLPIKIDMGLGFCIANVLLMLGKTIKRPWSVIAVLLSTWTFNL